MVHLYIVSSNPFYAHALKTLLNNNSTLFSSIYCGDVFHFLSQRISKEENNVLLLHTESLQSNKEQELAGQLHFEIFNKVILVDLHEEIVRRKVKIRNVYFDFISSSLEYTEFVKSLFRAMDGTNSQEGKWVQEAVGHLQTLRYLHYSLRFSEEELEILQMFKEDVLDKTIIDRLGINLYKYHQLKLALAEKLQVANQRTTILMKALAIGIVASDEPDETFNLPLFL